MLVIIKNEDGVFKCYDNNGIAVSLLENGDTFTLLHTDIASAYKTKKTGHIIENENGFLWVFKGEKEIIQNGLIGHIHRLKIEHNNVLVLDMQLETLQKKWNEQRLEDIKESCDLNIEINQIRFLENLDEIKAYINTVYPNGIIYDNIIKDLNFLFKEIFIELESNFSNGILFELQKNYGRFLGE